MSDLNVSGVCARWRLFPSWNKQPSQSDLCVQDGRFVCLIVGQSQKMVTKMTVSYFCLQRAPSKQKMSADAGDCGSRLCFKFCKYDHWIFFTCYQQEMFVVIYNWKTGETFGHFIYKLIKRDKNQQVIQRRLLVTAPSFNKMSGEY